MFFKLLQKSKRAYFFLQWWIRLFYSSSITCDTHELGLSSTSRSLKTFFLLNVNIHLSIPSFIWMNLNGNYDSDKLLLLHVSKYEEHSWDIIRAFKIVAFLMNSKRGLLSFPVIFVFGLVGTLQHINIRSTDQKDWILFWKR